MKMGDLRINRAISMNSNLTYDEMCRLAMIKELIKQKHKLELFPDLRIFTAFQELIQSCVACCRMG